MTARVFRETMDMPSIRWLLGRAWDARVWRPERARLFWFQIAGRDRNVRAGLTDRDHLLAAAHWLGRAQDASRDGGVCGRYRLGRAMRGFPPLPPTPQRRDSRLRDSRKHRPAPRIRHYDH